MGNKKQRANTKQTYKRSNGKYYVKSDPKAMKKEIISDLAVKGIALAFYPFYLAISETGKLVKRVKSGDFSRSKLNFKTKEKAFQMSLPKMNMTNLKFNIEKAVNQVRDFGIKGVQFVEERFPKPFNNKWVVTGVTSLTMVSIVGVMALANLQPQKIDDIQAQNAHVVTVNVPKQAVAVDATEVEAVAQPLEVPAFKVKSFASVKSYQIVVNNRIVANFQTQNEAERLLAAIKSEFENPEGAVVEDVYFYEDVKVEEGSIDIVKFEGYDNVETALAYVRKGTKQEKLHVVQKGENYWVIANYYGIDPYDLEAANPEIKAEQLQIGTEISLVVPRPLITVCTVEKATYSDQIAFDVTYEQSGSLYKGESRTKVNGVYGEKEIVAEIVRQNGREIMRTILSENVVAEPQTKVVYQGTKDPPPRMGTGTFIKPMSGVISSEFGEYRGNSRHKGIDIANRTGNSVLAADGGVVLIASYNSSYGRYIIVDHGNNLTTLYAHNSSLSVARGDKVFQGQTIALSGNTGYSTGPHLHFEVRVNGVPQNPRHYVKF